MSFTHTAIDSLYITPVSVGERIVSIPDSTLTVYTSQPVGIKGIPITYGSNSHVGISFLILICFLLVVVSFQSSSKFIHQILAEVIDNKPRRGFFQKSNLGLVRLKVALLIMTFLMEGLALYFIFNQKTAQILSSEKILLIISIFSGIFCAWYLLQLFFCSLLGYIFSNKNYTSLWTSSLTSTTALLGLLLFLPVLIAIYHHLSLHIFIIITFILYIITRLFFIYKGVKIFFRDFYSLIYVVLYLCTFEIAPLLVIYKGLFLLFGFLELKLV